MRKTILTLMIATVLVFSLVPTVFAVDGQPPQGSCPSGFVIHTVGEHENHDHHIGLTVDLNRDGFICVNHLDNGLHVHVDNVIR